MAAVIILGGYAIEGHVGLNLMDEGFLWDGVLKTRSGLAPTRDFASYEPLRYYWCAAVSSVVGPGIAALRLACALAALVGLACGLSAASRVIRQPLALFLVGVVLAAWMVPRWKAFDCSMSLVALLVLTRWVERPDRARAIAAGMLPGLASLVGRNHGLYALAASAIVMAVIAWKQRGVGAPRMAAHWLVGLAVGFAPLALWLLCMPGMLDAYLAHLADTASHGAIDVSLNVPWPWITWPAEYPRGIKYALWATGWGFILAISACVALALVTLCTASKNLAARAVYVAAAVVGAIYMHCTAYRPDTPHLAQAIGPALVGAMVMGWASLARAPIARPALLGGLLVFSLFATHLLHPAVEWARDWRHGNRWRSYDVAGTTLLLPPHQVAFLETVRTTIAAHASPTDAVMIAPTEPMLYPALGRICPIGNSYPLVPASAAVQRRMIDDLRTRGVRLVLVNRASLDNRQERHFSHTHPVVWEELRRSYVEVDEAARLPGYFVFAKPAEVARRP